MRRARRARRAAAVLLVLALAGPAPADEVIAVGEDAVPVGPTVEERLAEIRRRIQAAVVYPRQARSRGLEGVAKVGFHIDRSSGLAQEIQLVGSSGYTSLDRAAEKSVIRAGTLPWVYGRLEVPVRFSLELP